MRYRPTSLLETGPFELVADSYQWYENRGGVFLAPARECFYPDDFEEKNVYKIYQEDPSAAPHLELLQMDLEDKSQIKTFVEKWGLLGVGKKWEWIRNWDSADHLDEVEVMKTIGFSQFEERRTEASPEEWFRIPGEDYFESILAPDFALESVAGSTPCDRSQFFELYGEWVETEKYPFTGSLSDQNPAIPQSYKELSYKPPTFTEAVRDFREKARYLLRKRNKKKRTFPGTYVRDLKPAWDEDNGKIERVLHGASLLDFCYYMLYEDFRQGAITQCVDCSDPIRNDPHRRGPKKKFCDESCLNRFHKRKARQKQDFSGFLSHSEMGLEDWPQTENNIPEHPYDLIGEMNEQQKKMAEKWAKTARQKQQGKEFEKPNNSKNRWREDPLLEPFLD